MKLLPRQKGTVFQCPALFMTKCHKAIKQSPTIDEVAKLKKRVQDFQTSLDNMTSQHDGCVTQAMLNAKEKEYERKIQQVQEKLDASMETAVTIEARVRREFESQLQV